MKYNNKQEAAIRMAKEWFNFPVNAVFTIGGYAGTGKTTVAKGIIDSLGVKPEEVAFVAFTGKAANVMASKGMTGAKTIHSLIYHPKELPDGGVIFQKKPKKALRGLKLIVLDEASMVGKKIFQDLMSYDIPILALGDPGQLPPVSSLRTGLLDHPDVLLEEIMRQDAGSGIVRFAEAVRNGHIPVASDDGKFGKEVKILPSSVAANDAAFAKIVTKSQIICGKNATRIGINRYAKTSVFDKNPDKFQKGDKVICLENNFQCSAESNVGKLTLVNGLSGIMASDIMKNADEHQHFYLEIPELDACFDAPFGYQKFSEVPLLNFDFAYAITCHKSQGSEYDNLTVLDEPVGAKAAQWRYTAITRAKKQLLYLV